MKSLKLFKNLEVKNMSSIYGGDWKDSPKETGTDENGCIVTKTESYNDSNNNGRPDPGEDKMICVSVDC
jgi:hypothetical protein